MQQLNQIVLCSQTKGRSYLREIAVFDKFGVVTNTETLPFRYHEVLAKKRGKNDLVTTLEVPIRRTASHRGCPYCGRRTIFQCNRCGFVSCADADAGEHHCPGCDRTHKSERMTGTHASESGFVDKALVDSPSTDRWNEAQAKLLGLIEHRNRRA